MMEAHHAVVPAHAGTQMLLDPAGVYSRESGGGNERSKSNAAPNDTRSVVPAHAGTHIPEAVVMGPRFRGDDSI
jgi:hypothetical protein